MDQLTSLCDEKLSGDYYLIGNSAMNFEMEKSFGGEMLLITLLTAIAIFIVVAVTFRSLIIPVILVLIVQCGVYITVSIIGLQGYSIYYLALLIVQCILMGATIDYGILFTNYYREQRGLLDGKEALSAAYDGSIHTILTSASIMVLVTGIIGYCFFGSHSRTDLQNHFHWCIERYIVNPVCSAGTAGHVRPAYCKKSTA